MTKLREQIIEEMKARRIDHKTYTDADWLMAEYEKHTAQVLCELLEGEKKRTELDKSSLATGMQEYWHNKALEQAQALIRQTLDPISSNE